MKKPYTKKKRYKQPKPKPRLWAIDDDNGEIVRDNILLDSGDTVIINLTYVHAHYLAWLQETQTFDVATFILNIIGTTKADQLNNVIQTQITRLYIHRDTRNLKRPNWLAAL